MNEWLESLFERAYGQRSVNKKWLNGSLPIFVYGTGTFAYKAYLRLMELGVYVSAFLDHRGSVPAFFNGVPVLHPSSALGGVVVLGIHNRDANILEIIHNLSGFGAKHVISPVELFDFLETVSGNSYWLTNWNFYTTCKAFIGKGQSLLTDEISQSLYSSIIEFRLTGDYTVLPKPDFENQYLPPDLSAWKLPLRLVDCGAFDGDTLSAFIKAGIKIEAVAVFEPDQINFSKLSQFVAAHPKEIPDAILYPCGVSLSTTQLAFIVGQGEASAISRHGGDFVQCVSLDDVIPTYAPNLIKMDIEGAEYDALLGARNIINKYLPGLAISIYHHPAHLWQVPLLIDDIAPGKYDFYLRSHAMSTFDTVLYAIPNSIPSEME